MKRYHQRSISFIMTAVYLLVTLSPLASISARSHPFGQTLARECSGDCRLCGCSTERSASHSCCCWQKKVAAEKTRHQCAVTSLSTAAVAGNGVKTGGCCNNYLQQYAAAKTTLSASLSDHLPDDAPPAVSVSTCPCGSGKDLAFSGGERSQHIPCRFVSGVPPQPASHFTFLQTEQFASRSGEPPDPPPKLVTS